LKSLLKILLPKYLPSIIFVEMRTCICRFYSTYCSNRAEKYKTVFLSVAELHHFYAAPALGKNFDAAPDPAAPAPTLLYSKAKFLKRTKV
jgi:hypothetical protein